MLHILVGPSATGKSSLASLLPPEKRVPSVTTRPRREGEGYEDYIFVDDETFDAMTIAGELDFFRCYNVGGKLWRYALRRAEIMDAVNNLEDRLIILDPNGARHCTDLYGERVRVYFLTAHPQARARRMFKRGDDPVHVGERLSQDAEDFKFYNNWTI